MNKETFLNNDVETNVSEEEITLAPPVKLFDEAKEIAKTTVDDDKFPFMLHYDANQKEHLLSMLGMVGAIVEDDDDDGHVLATMMNMTQLAFIKRLDCVERVKTDEGEVRNPFLMEEAAQPAATMAAVASAAPLEMGTMQTEPIMTPVANDGIAVASASAGARSSCGSSSSCGCPTNTSMATAREINVESIVSGNICCPGVEQWFKFVATKDGQHTIYTIGSLDTIGTLYDGNGNLLAYVNNYEPCGKLNFRIIHNLTAGNTYYVKVQVAGENTGSYHLKVTDAVLAESVTVTPSTFTLQKGVWYELPLSQNYTYRAFDPDNNPVQRISGLSVSITPSNATNQDVWWYEEYGSILQCRYGWDNVFNGNRYIHVKADNVGTAKLYAVDWNEHGAIYECTVTVVTPYEKMLQDLGGFSNEVIRLISTIYERIDTVFTSENTLQKAWRCARLLSEFTYDSFSFNDVAGSLTNQENRKSYFTNILGYTENEYTSLEIAFSDNYADGNTIDFTHLQYSLAARLAYKLEIDGWASNLGSQFKTGNWGIYSDEDISYLAGWLGDATLRNDGGTGEPILKNDDYMSDLDAENVYRLLLQGYTSIEALNVYYSYMTESNTRSNIFLQYIPYSTVKQKIFYELIDAKLYELLSQASGQTNIALINYYVDLINDEQYHYNTIKSQYSDTYNFLMSLNDRLSTIKDYQ